MSGVAIDVGVLGATGAVGEQVLSALSEASLPIGEIHAFASRARKTNSVNVGERSIAVGDLENVPDDLSLAFVALPAHVAARVIPGLIRQGTFVIEIGGGSGLLPLYLPGVTNLSAEAIAEPGGIGTPSAPAWLLASFLAPLSGFTGASGVMALSASASGRDGIDELGAGVAALMNSKDPPRRVFPEGLAFDAVPDGDVADEWSAGEREVAATVAALTGAPEERIAISLVQSSLFAGITAGLHLRGVGLSDAEAAWEATSGLHRVERTARLRPRAMMGKKGLYWGRLREDPGGEGIHFWAVGDNLSGAGAAVPVRAAEWMNAQGLFTRAKA